ncbi:DUF4065 domain-containing protein [Clostridioides difficile]|nr:DUF4065 domain-containing protein [Clostridioides difficile]
MGCIEFNDYDAIDIANYILWYCENKLKNPSTNLRLQKLLYLIQERYLYLYKDSIFSDKFEWFEAWDYGPTMPEVWFTFYEFNSKPITGIIPKNNDLVKDKEKDTIEEVIEFTKDISTEDIIEYLRLEEPEHFIGRQTISSFDIEYYIEKRNGVLISKELLDKKLNLSKE